MSMVEADWRAWPVVRGGLGAFYACWRKVAKIHEPEASAADSAGCLQGTAEGV